MCIINNAGAKLNLVQHVDIVFSFGNLRQAVLPEGHIADEYSYKYCGIPQANGDHEKVARKADSAKSLQRVRKVLRSQLNGKNKVRAINT